ncbi:MAG: CorA family divalent cation transporter [Bacteroidales bacterium]
MRKGCWVNVTRPTHEEIARLTGEFNLPNDIVQDILDIDERPRVEIDDTWSLSGYYACSCRELQQRYPVSYRTRWVYA